MQPTHFVRIFFDANAATLGGAGIILYLRARDRERDIEREGDRGVLCVYINDIHI